MCVCLTSKAKTTCCTVRRRRRGEQAHGVISSFDFRFCWALLAAGPASCGPAGRGCLQRPLPCLLPPFVLFCKKTKTCWHPICLPPPRRILCSCNPGAAPPGPVAGVPGFPTGSTPQAKLHKPSQELALPYTYTRYVHVPDFWTDKCPGSRMLRLEETCCVIYERAHGLSLH